MPHTFTIINLVTLITYLVTVVLALPLCRLRPEVRGYVIPFWLLTLHGAVYYTALAWSSASGGVPFWHDTFNFQTWSGVLRLHGALTICGAMVTLFIDAIQDRKPV